MLASLYTDEDMSVLVATLLKSRGLDVMTAPEQNALGKTDREQLELATSLDRCLVTHNRVDFERLHLDYNQNNKLHFGIIIVPQKNAYELAKRISVLIRALSIEEIKNQLLYC